MHKHTFHQVSPVIHFPDLEEKVLAYWKEKHIFEKSYEGKSKKKSWTFLDGPPFITGLPHYGSLLSSIPKDVFPRYWTMKGYRVRRVWGWDCHGLPAENKVESMLRITRKKDIEEKIGIRKFIDACKSYVNNVSNEWEWYIDHIARWVDFKNAYKTMDLTYMESVMWVFKKMYDKEYIYKGLRISLYCPHCATPISNFEVAMDQENYKTVTEPSNIYKYQLKDDISVFILAFSTTPWNKIVTPALAVNSSVRYVKIKQNNEYYILAKSCLKTVIDGPFEIMSEFSGKSLVGKEFIPHYNYFKIEPGKKAFQIVPGDFVTIDEGTGVVTIAAYGEDDLTVMMKENIQIITHLDDEGILKSNVPRWAGMNYLKVNPLVNKDLKDRGLMYREDQFTHSVPTCWRCHTRLYYAPQNAWYVNIQKLKEKMKKTNDNITWIPNHFKYGRFAKSMEAAPDWCISRSRYWGSPVPVWECSCGERFVPGSIVELVKASGTTVQDLHKPDIDEVTVKCANCGKRVHRVSEVLDSWIEAGSAPFAERHYPFDKTIHLTDFFPPDFITEYTGQIRAWFYVLHVIACALYGSHAFNNVLVTGVILGTDGRKMSKNYGNYPDPKEMLTKYGGDALRLYLLSSPVMHAEDIRISEFEYRNQIKGLMIVLWNVYNFFINNVRADGWIPDKKPLHPRYLMNRWILSRLQGNIQGMTSEGYEKYNTPEIIKYFSLFMKDLSQWYIRRIRNDVGPNSDSVYKSEVYQTLWYVLVHFSKVLAPIIPFMTEEMYRNLTGEQSVHLTHWPTVNTGFHKSDLEAMVEAGKSLASIVHKKRKSSNIKVRIPVKRLTYTGPFELTGEIQEIIQTEVNVYNLVYTGYSKEFRVPEKFDSSILDIPAGIERELIHSIQLLRKGKLCTISQHIEVQLPSEYKMILKDEHLNNIMRKTLALKVTWGKSLEILIG